MHGAVVWGHGVDVGGGLVVVDGEVVGGVGMVTRRGAGLRVELAIDDGGRTACYESTDRWKTGMA